MTSTTDPDRIAKPRRDGWMPARRRAFLDHLRGEGDVRRAALRVGMSRRSAYYLRGRDPGFARAWDAALREARDEDGRRLIASLVERAPWARAAFPQWCLEACREGGETFSQDSVPSVPCV